MDALAPLGPVSEILGEPAGHHLTLRIRNGMSESDLVSSAAGHGVRVYPVSPYFLRNVPKEYQSTVLLGFGGLQDDAIRQGAALLYEAWT